MNNKLMYKYIDKRNEMSNQIEKLFTSTAMNDLAKQLLLFMFDNKLPIDNEMVIIKRIIDEFKYLIEQNIIQINYPKPSISEDKYKECITMYDNSLKILKTKTKRQMKLSWNKR